MRAPDARGFANARIVVGVTGGIAAYKAAELTSSLVKMGADVHVVMTEAAHRFIAPMTFQALTRRPVFTSVFDGWEGDQAGHVTIAHDADAMIIAPATANTMAKLVAGAADSMLTTIALATPAPVVCAPAMEHDMWHHAATQANVAALRRRGVTVVEPETGHLASGRSGDGRLPENSVLIGALRTALGRGRPLSGKHILISAGGTHEPLDPVRFIGNGSSGRMGAAIADAAVDAGAQVTMVVGPTMRDVPTSARVERVETALDMQAAIEREVPSHDVLIMAAAVADYRADAVADRKIKKRTGENELQLHLVRNPDILAGIDPGTIIKIGFAAETHDLEAYAREKVRTKRARLIVANDAVATIGSDDVQATLVWADQAEARPLPRMSKETFAAALIDEVIGMMAEMIV